MTLTFVSNLMGQHVFRHIPRSGKPGSCKQPFKVQDIQQQTHNTAISTVLI